MKKLSTFLVSTLLCLFTMFSPLAPLAPLAYGQDGETQNPLVNVEKPVLLAELVPEFKVTLEGEALQTEVSKDQDGTVLVRAEPIFTALNDVFEYDVEGGVLVVQRSQDGVVMELYTDTGIVKANGKALGKLKQYGQISVGSINLTPNAIAVMSGAIGKIDTEANKIDFNLDPRLKVATGFEVFVEDIQLGNLEPGPKAIGSVMLLPLRPIAKELGHTIQII
ncbi:MAG: hypothetical protein L3J05_08390, partial [Robiginitomaculum sp.]|nr:hypothetical protein [Robiginitomaculum sp.]